MTPDGKPIHSGVSRARVEKVLDEGGKLSYGELLHCRVRYFSDGMIIGSNEFVNSLQILGEDGGKCRMSRLDPDGRFSRGTR